MLAGGQTSLPIVTVSREGLERGFGCKNVESPAGPGTAACTCTAAVALHLGHEYVLDMAGACKECLGDGLAVQLVNAKCEELGLRSLAARVAGAWRPCAMCCHPVEAVRALID